MSDSTTPRPFNALTDVPSNMTFSVNSHAAELMGPRSTSDETAVVLNMPCEEGFHCPVCQYEHLVEGTYDERLDWSEYAGFLWCAVCNKDYPSALCMPDIDRAIDIFLKTVANAVDRALHEKEGA